MYHQKVSWHFRFELVPVKIEFYTSDVSSGSIHNFINYINKLESPESLQGWYYNFYATAERTGFSSQKLSSHVMYLVVWYVHDDSKCRQMVALTPNLLLMTDHLTTFARPMTIERPANQTRISSNMSVSCIPVVSQMSYKSQYYDKKSWSRLWLMVHS
jgi:hypothetical protein